MGWMSSPWFWWAIALALFAAEAMMPGTFMLWLGFAAVATGLVDLVITLSPTVQWLIFGVFSLISVAMGWRWRATHKDSPSDQPLLNQRGAQLVGRVFPWRPPSSMGAVGSRWAMPSGRSKVRTWTRVRVFVSSQ